MLEKYQTEILQSCTEDQDTTVLAAFELSFKRVEVEDAVAGKLLTLLAFLHRTSFWKGLILADGGDELEEEYSWLAELSQNELRLTNVLGKIFSLSLAKQDGGVDEMGGSKEDGVVEMHTLVHSWGRQRLGPAAKRQKLIEAIIVVGRAAGQGHAGSDKDTHRLRSRILPHADHCMKLLNEQGAEEVFSEIFQTKGATNAVFSIGILLQENTRLQDAEQIFTAIISQQNVPSSACTPIMVANSQRRLGQILTLFSRYQEAEATLSSSIASLTALLGPHHHDTLKAKFELGMVHHRCFRYEDASLLLKGVMEADTCPSSTSNADTPPAATMGPLGREAASVLALVYRHLGKHRAGLALLDTALAQLETSPHNNNNNNTNTISSPAQKSAHLLTLHYRRALLLRQLGHWSAALNSYTATLSGMKSSPSMGPSHPLTLRLTNALGYLLCLYGRYPEARQMYNIALSGQEKLGFSRDGETAMLRTRFNLAVLDREEGRLEEAGRELEAVLQVERQRYGDEAYSTLRCRVEMAVLRGVRGEVERGVGELEEVLEVQMRRYPEGVEEQTDTRVVLAEGMMQMGRWEGARAVLAPALGYVRGELPGENPVRLRVELVEARCLVGVGREGEMEVGVDELVEMLETTYGLKHPLAVQGRALLSGRELGTL